MSSPPSSPNKRPKIQNPENNLHENPPSPSPSPSEDNDNDNESMSDCCGICYGASMRGEIDCCTHFFCFVCIMEWSKHESRCPLCRQRFSSVKRPHRPGLFSSSRLVKIPIRDQVILLCFTFHSVTHHFGCVNLLIIIPFLHVANKDD